MGIKGFLNIVEYYAPLSKIIREFKNYRGTCQSIDGSIAIYKFCIPILDTPNFWTVDNKFIGHLFACFFKSLGMLKYGIMPLWVFDGPPPVIKQSTLDRRRNVRVSAATKLGNERIDIDEINRLHKKAFILTSKHVSDIKHLLTLMGLPYVESPGEAEAQCAALNIANVSHGVVTEDWDALFFGCYRMLKEFSNKSNVIEIDNVELMRSLKMNRIQLIDLGAILGNDYCVGIGGLKPLDAYHKFKECNFDVDELLSLLEKDDDNRYYIPHDFKEQMQRSKEYYLHAPVVDPKEVNTKWKKPDYFGMYDYLVREKGFNINVIRPKIDDLEILHERYSVANKLVTMSRIKKEQREMFVVRSYDMNYEKINGFLRTMRTKGLVAG
jgi:flap endonuclease-1